MSEPTGWVTAADLRAEFARHLQKHRLIRRRIGGRLFLLEDAADAMLTKCDVDPAEIRPRGGFISCRDALRYLRFI